MGFAWGGVACGGHMRVTWGSRGRLTPGALRVLLEARAAEGEVELLGRKFGEVRGET